MERFIRYWCQNSKKLLAHEAAEGRKPGPHPVLQATAALARKILQKAGFLAHTHCSARLVREPELRIELRS